MVEAKLSYPGTDLGSMALIPCMHTWASRWRALAPLSLCCWVGRLKESRSNMGEWEGQPCV